MESRFSFQFFFLPYPLPVLPDCLSIPVMRTSTWRRSFFFISIAKFLLAELKAAVATEIWHSLANASIVRSRIIGLLSGIFELSWVTAATDVSIRAPSEEDVGLGALGEVLSCKKADIILVCFFTLYLLLLPFPPFPLQYWWRPWTLFLLLLLFSTFFQSHSICTFSLCVFLRWWERKIL